MLTRVASAVLGFVNFWLFLLALVLAFTLLVPFAVLKLLVPIRPVQRSMVRMMDFVGGDVWRWLNAMPLWLALGGSRDVRLEGLPLTRDKTWLLVSNHRSWADIPLVVGVLCRQAPFARFFLKQQLLWVPIIGLACWAFDMPFMKRHTKSQIAANPALANDDLNATRRACEKFRTQPVTVVNFVEGTRFSEAKRVARGSPFQHLLRPKSGGLAFAVGAMGEQFAGVIDVTLMYRRTRRGQLWGFLCGDQHGMRVHVGIQPLPAWMLRGNYSTDAAYRARFQTWVNDLWRAKEARIENFLAEHAAEGNREPGV
ncbi:MAG TPA: acetyltransferase [Nevskiaceae bacterium]|nr:acetyltransferase [Nevskiaceae bacterium]